MENALATRGIALGSIIIFASLCVFLFAYLALRTDNEKKKWPTVEGDILTMSGVSKTSMTKHKTSRSGYQSSRTEDVWNIIVEYEYLVDDTLYMGTRVASSSIYEPYYENSLEPSEYLKNIASQVVAGAKILVHYNPENPRDESYLLFIQNREIKKGLIWGIILLIIGASLIVWSVGYAQNRKIKNDYIRNTIDANYTEKQTKLSDILQKQGMNIDKN